MGVGEAAIKVICKNGLDVISGSCQDNAKATLTLLVG